MELRATAGQRTSDTATLNGELKHRLVRIFEAASENSEIFMRHQNGCIIVEDRAPADFTAYLEMMRSNSPILTELNAYMKLSFTDRRNGHEWAFLLNKETFLALEADLDLASV